MRRAARVWWLFSKSRSSIKPCRTASQRTRNKPVQNSNGNGFWQGVGDTVFFQPYKSDTLPMWRDMYKLKRQLKDIERGTYRLAPEDSWLGRQKRALIDTWHDFVDEVKALLTELAFHVVTLVLVVVYNILWFAFLFWLIGVWLGS